MHILKHDVRDTVDPTRAIILKHGAKKVLSGNSVGLVDFGVGLVESVLHLPDR